MPDVAPLLASLPLLGALVRGFQSFVGRDLERRARRHAELLAALPETSDATALSALLDAELAEVARQGEARLHRKLNASSAAALVVVLIIASGVVWLLWTLPVTFTLPTWALWTTRALAAFVAVFAALLMLAGFGSLFQDSREERSG